MVDIITATTYNFALISAVASRHPLWEDRLGEGSAAPCWIEGLSWITAKRRWRHGARRRA